MAETILTVNGSSFTVDAPPEMPLLWVFRDLLHLTGTKYGCGIGQCGSCTVHLDETPVRSCVTPLAQVDGRAITTIEGLSATGAHPLQEAFVELNVAQCGYCQPGQIMTAAALLIRRPNPTEDEVAETMRDVLCRCGTYLRIREAIRLTAERQQ
ncbi:MAG: (2Fe-2S)-binding protein [bacterium]|nr:(2Fe-2S)-binding protein [bacterium]